MQKKFFIRRFIRYFLLLIIPTFLVFVIAFGVVDSQIGDTLDTEAKNTLSNIDTNLDLVVSSVVFQNDQLTNNSYMVLSLKKLLSRDTNISLSDSIYLRNIKTMLNSILQSYPYVQSVYLYLDGYDRYFASDVGVADIDEEVRTGWLDSYGRMSPEQKTNLEDRLVMFNGKNRKVLTIYQRMLLLDGVVIMNLDADKYHSLLNDILLADEGIVLYINEDNEILFSWNDAKGETANFDLAEFQRTNGRQDTWTKVDGRKFLVHTAYNERYNLHLVSLIPRSAKNVVLWQMLKLFSGIFLINSIAMLALAYVTTRRTFNQLHYMVQVFYDAESGIYPTEPKQEMKDEYDVIMNNIIYLFLRTVKLNGDLTKKQHEQEVAELRALQLQINPHFLFNTMQTVQLEIKKTCPSADNAEKILDDLSDILKYALADPMEVIRLREEIEYLKRYVAIQQFRFGDKFIMYYEIEEGLMDFMVFRLMLQPLVENSILHGIRNKEERGYIKLQIFKRKDRVVFRVLDNGIGMSKEECRNLNESMRTPDVHHIGLTNVNSRLLLRFGEEARLRIRSKKGMGCVMEFSLPTETGIPDRLISNSVIKEEK